MRYLRTIAAFVAVLLSAACTVDPTVVPSVQPDSDDSIMVIGRVTHFDDYDVSTRSSKKPETEGMIYNMAVAIFPIENNAIGNCVYYEYKNGSEVLFTIDRQIRDPQSNEYIYNVDKPYVMYVFANCEEMESVNTSYTLEQMKAIISSVDGIGMHTDENDRQCFPMMGSLGDAIDTNGDNKGDNTISPEGDGKMFILKPNSASDPGLPLVNGDESDLLTIPMDAMFAKINFTIKVTADQFIEDNFSSRFVLSGYDVNNVPEEVTFSKSENSVGKTDVVTNVKSYSSNNVTSASNVAVGANTVTFSFYLPERYLTPATESKDYDYPFKKDGVIRGQDSVYMQRFKPLLADAENQKPTFVTIRGEYRDHQNHLYEVDYNIYLGSDNYGNFDISRNGEYNNYITIRGVTASDDMSHKQNVVSIDHRVNVNWKSPVIINLRREVLLDSHFEVRPMRIRKSEVDNSAITAIKVEVADEDEDGKADADWVRLERSFGDGTAAGSPTVSGNSIYITDTNSPSYGKRRYFTYGLVSGKSADGSNEANSLVNSTSVAVPLTYEGECIWIYVDECTEADVDKVRYATLRVTCGTLDSKGEFVASTLNGQVLSTDYVIGQHYLFPVTYNGHTYNIEYEEEYLHNFDAEDNYGTTEYDGMKWGMEGLYISSQYNSYNNSGFIGGIISWLANVPTKYDFYLPRDKDIAPSGVTTHPYAGQSFTQRIVKAANIGVLDLATSPNSAVEYCVNRNKRNVDGSLPETFVWYLPAVDEIEEIAKGCYSFFRDFQGQYYWSSQPSFLIYDLHYYYVGSWSDWRKEDIIMQDNKDRARATKVYYQNGAYDAAILSGTPNNYSTGLVTCDWGGYKGTQDYPTDGLKDEDMYEPGNQPRTEKNRIRCVRKAN